MYTCAYERCACERCVYVLVFACVHVCVMCAWCVRVYTCVCVCVCLCVCACVQCCTAYITNGDIGLMFITKAGILSHKQFI